eukprot:g39270.t1
MYHDLCLNIFPLQDALQAMSDTPDSSTREGSLMPNSVECGLDVKGCYSHLTSGIQFFLSMFGPRLLSGQELSALAKPKLMVIVPYNTMDVILNVKIGLHLHKVWAVFALTITAMDRSICSRLIDVSKEDFAALVGMFLSLAFLVPGHCQVICP